MLFIKTICDTEQGAENAHLMSMIVSYGNHQKLPPSTHTRRRHRWIKLKWKRLPLPAYTEELELQYAACEMHSFRKPENTPLTATLEASYPYIFTRIKESVCQLVCICECSLWVLLAILPVVTPHWKHHSLIKRWWWLYLILSITVIYHILLKKKTTRKYFECSSIGKYQVLNKISISLTLLELCPMCTCTR